MFYSLRLRSGETFTFDTRIKEELFSLKYLVINKRV